MAQSEMVPLGNFYYYFDKSGALTRTEEMKEEVIVTPTTKPGDSTTTQGKTYTMEATAYTHTGNKTATGVWPEHNPNGYSTVAVDPRIIPLGTKLYISGYGNAIAADTGGAIKGNIVDVFFNSYDECIRWGRRTVQVTILD